MYRMTEMMNLVVLVLCIQHIQCAITSVSNNAIQEKCQISSLNTGLEIDCSHIKLYRVPQDLPVNVTRLSLRRTKLSSVYRAFSNYPHLVYLDISENNIHTFQDGAFFNLSKLEVLEMAFSNTYVLQQDAFQYLASLKSLNLACNFIGLRNVMKGLANAPFRIEYLILDDTKTHNTPLVMDRDIFKGVDFTNLQGISLRDEHLVSLDTRSFEALQNMKHFVLGFDTPLLVKPQDQSKTIENVLMALKNVVSLDVSHLYIPAGRMFENKYCATLTIKEKFRYPKVHFNKKPPNLNSSAYDISGQLTTATGFLSNLPPGLRYLTVRDLPSFVKHSRPLTFSSNIQYLNISSVHFEEITTPIIGLIYLEIFELSNCGLKYITSPAFDNLSSLRYLYLQGNKLRFGQLELKKTFRKLTNLVHLDLSDNGLTKLDIGTFYPLSRLLYINLANNLFKILDLNMSTLTSLKTLDLTWNRLGMVSEVMSTTLDLSSQNITIHLQHNAFLCDCSDSTSLVRWIHTQQMKNSSQLYFNNVNFYQCSNGKESVLQFLQTSVDSTQPCEVNKSVVVTVKHTNVVHIAYLYIAIATSLGVPLICGIVSYCFRWKIRWWYYTWKLRLFEQRHQPTASPSTVHAYIAHSFHSDVALSWTINTLIPKVEGEWGFHLFVWERDSEGGLPIADNIVKAIQSSGITLIIVEPALCSDEWMDFVFHMALIKKRYLLVRIGNVDLSQVSPTLHQMMGKGCLEWPSSQSVLASERDQTERCPTNMDMNSICDDDRHRSGSAEEPHQNEIEISVVTNMDVFQRKRELYLPSTANSIRPNRMEEEKYFWKCLKKILAKIVITSNEDIPMTMNNSIVQSPFYY